MPNVVVEHRHQSQTLTAKSIKAALVLNPAEIVSIPVPDGKPRCSVRIAVAGRTLTADLNAKSVRRAIANIREAGADNVSCILQGRLDGNNALLDCRAGCSTEDQTRSADQQINVRLQEMQARSHASATRTALEPCHSACSCRSYLA